MNKYRTNRELCESLVLQPESLRKCSTAHFTLLRSPREAGALCHDSGLPPPPPGKNSQCDAESPPLNKDGFAGGIHSFGVVHREEMLQSVCELNES